MVHIWVDRTEGKVKLQTDDPSVYYLFEVTKKEDKYIPWKRAYGTITSTTRIYDGRRPRRLSDGFWYYSFGLGWAAYLINVLKPYISQSDYENVLREAIYSDSVRSMPFPMLRDYQNEDVLHLLKYRIGLLSVYTSYGKTQVIATIADYAYRLGKKVLLVCPGQRAKDELVKRCKKVFGLDVPSADGRIECIITTGLLNRKDVKSESGREKFINHLKEFDWVLADEVEYTINNSGDLIYSNVTGATNLYGFSGTADKEKGEQITFINGLSDVVIRNAGLVKYFGPSLVYRMPLHNKIDCITVKTRSLGGIDFGDETFGDSGNVYNSVMTKIWTNPEVCKCLVRVAKKYKMPFIPINNLNAVIDEWINKYFIGEFRILLICHEGYIYIDLDGSRKSLSLQEACDYVKDGKVDIIPSTSSGYRALDLPNLENAIIIQGKCAGVVLQCIGRTARLDHFNIITLAPTTEKKIPVYTKGMEGRDELIHTFYKYCEVTDSVIYEDTL